MKKSLLTPGSISKLAADIKREIRNMELDVKGRVTLGYWRIGRWVNREILKNKGRAQYGDHVYEQLVPVVSLNKRTLERTVQLYRTYPIASRLTQLPWSHFLHLMTVKDEKQRKQLEHQAILKGWSVDELKDKMTTIQAATAETRDDKKDAEKEIPQLTVVRGRVNTFALVEDEGEKDLLVDMGFRLHWGFAQIKRMRLQKDACVQVRDDRFFKTALVPKEQLFTYKAGVKKIIDGDTLIARVHLNFRMFLTQKFRLRGIDCPEINTPEGKRAKRFVEERLNGLDFIVVKTHKDTTDKYDRYLADVFYAPRLPQSREAASTPRAQGGRAGVTIDFSGPTKVAQAGNYLNQELLDAGLARLWQNGK
ncbi:MAG: thermonuclease family protein [Candidatus Omnitrophica bacterium]|nr:thermonuclease family protein [Candidatus Omnitrophota bacterium]